MTMYPDLAGKVAVITGAGRTNGLGAAIARKLASNGARIVVHDLGKAAGDMAPDGGVGGSDEMRAVAADIRAAGAEVTTFAADMRAEDEVAALVAHAVATFGRLDIGLCG